MARTYRRKDGQARGRFISPRSLKFENGRLFAETIYWRNSGLVWRDITEINPYRDLIQSGITDVYEIAYRVNYKAAVRYHKDNESGRWNAPKRFRKWLNRQERRNWKGKFVNHLNRYEEDEFLTPNPKTFSTANWEWF